MASASSTRTRRSLVHARRLLPAGLVGLLACVVACDATPSDGAPGEPAVPAADASPGAAPGRPEVDASPGPRPPSGGTSPDAGATPDAARDSTSPDAGGPPRVFLDTDLVWDPGDVGALTLAHALADRCEIRLIGVTVVSTSTWAGSTADAINTYYGRSDIPVGVLTDGPFLETQAGYAQNLSRAFPNRFPQGTPAPDATRVFRETLAKQPDHSVQFVSIGPFRNLRHFLESSPDAASPLTGRELVAAKVVQLTAMAGVFADIGAFGGPVTSEWNVQQDVSAASYVVDDWPTPIVFSGFEVGWYMCPDAGIAQTDPASPLAAVLNGDPTPCGQGKGRPAWDQTALLYAARGKASYWTGQATGSVKIQAPGGEDTWSASPERHQGFLVNIGVDTRTDESTNRDLMAKSALGTAMVDLENGAGKIGACVAKK